MAERRRIYLDNAATSWPKPEAVYAAVERYQREWGAPAGRGVYGEAVEVERLVAEARQRVARLLGVDEPRRIIFTHNGTDALNLALHGLLRAGEHVVTSVVEHNSVLRPLREMQERMGVLVTRVPCDGQGLVDPDDVRKAIQPNTRLIALSHASNVTGALQSIEAVGRIAAEHNVFFLVDAAQSLGHIPFDVRQIRAHLVAAPGHKGLLGPLGTGMLYVAPGVEMSLASQRQGGTGTRSESDRQPETLPNKYESGNHNVPGILGLGAGLAFLEERGAAAIRAHELAVTGRLLAGLAEIPGVVIHGPREAALRVGVVSITVPGYEPQELAMLLDSVAAVQVRAGLHCAPLMHEALGTAASGGTLRYSVGPFNHSGDVETAVQTLASLTGEALAGI